MILLDVMTGDKLMKTVTTVQLLADRRCLLNEAQETIQPLPLVQPIAVYHLDQADHSEVQLLLYVPQVDHSEVQLLLYVPQAHDLLVHNRVHRLVEGSQECALVGHHNEVREEEHHLSFL